MAKTDRRRKAATNHVSYTDFRERLAAYMDQVSDSRAPLHVTRQNARTVVLISEEDYEGLVETVHLLRSPVNAARLLRSINQVNEDKLVERDIVER